MAIRMRRGPLVDYDEDKMVAGELAVTTDSTDEDQKIFVAFAPGISKRILTENDLEGMGGDLTATGDGTVTLSITRGGQT